MLTPIDRAIRRAQQARADYVQTCLQAEVQRLTTQLHALKAATSAFLAAVDEDGGTRAPAQLDALREALDACQA